MNKLKGCGNHGCWIAPVIGMGTNGPCRCDAHALKAAISILHRKIKEQEAKINDLCEEFLNTNDDEYKDSRGII